MSAPELDLPSGLTTNLGSCLSPLPSQIYPLDLPPPQATSDPWLVTLVFTTVLTSVPAL
ncbi:hypothetical protein M404DRAFT_28925 [Pisolithus tinctorius Marx 270]|uniref:Uncharacterized protein n=1 Tax=Pisolithus tinctorius Marx 270 TaxID=870435 RepID=A0A0C3JUR0_PISTI|nr:hypothetical protein M404DRAFT_28925 [Pisolithus tinctorius Marx 270]